MSNGSGVGLLLTVDWLICIFIYVATGLAFMNLAKKAGRNSIAWMAWVPFCSAILQLLLIKKNGWNILWYLVPIANIVFGVIWQVKLLRAFDKHGAFVLLNYLFFPAYYILWLVWGFSKDTKYTLIDDSEPKAA